LELLVIAHDKTGEKKAQNLRCLRKKSQKVVRSGEICLKKNEKLGQIKLF